MLKCTSYFKPSNSQKYCYLSYNIGKKLFKLLEVMHAIQWFAVKPDIGIHTDNMKP